MGVDVKLHWTQRPDGLWNANCRCGSVLSGFKAEDQEDGERWHEGKKRPEDQCGPDPMSCSELAALFYRASGQTPYEDSASRYNGIAETLEAFGDQPAPSSLLVKLPTWVKP